MTDLLPCPFCAQQPEGRYCGVASPAYQITCRCGAAVYGEDEDEATQRWHRRDYPLPGAVEPLPATLREIAVRALAVGPKDHNITLDEVLAIGDAAALIARYFSSQERA